MGVSINLDVAKIKKDISEKKHLAQIKLDSQVLKDSNYYCPMQQGTLKQSGIINTVYGSGKVIWRTPYARAQYYEIPYKSKQRNPNAEYRWFEKAKSVHMSNWIKLVKDVFRTN